MVAGSRAYTHGLSASVPRCVVSEPAEPDLTAFARFLGLADDADEAAIVAAIQSLPCAIFADALGLPPGSPYQACIAAAERLKAAEDAKVADLRDKLRTARVRIVMLEAIREAGDTLDP